MKLWAHADVLNANINVYICFCVLAKNKLAQLTNRELNTTACETTQKHQVDMNTHTKTLYDSCCSCPKEEASKIRMRH